MSLTRRLLRLLVLLIVLVALVVVGTGAYLVRRAFPLTAGVLAVPGLRAPVEVIRDRWGVPHIFAKNTPDLFFTQGYVQAQDRLWQMEFFRRTASGRLAEIFGEVTPTGESILDTDRFLRTIGLRRAAEAEWRTLNPETKGALEAYAAGVNAFVAQRRSVLPIEFALFQVQPEPWTPVDSLAFGKLMAWFLSGHWKSELLRAHLVSRYGVEGVRMLMPPYPATAPVIVPQEADYQSWNGAALLRLLAMGPAISGVGSNNWVVSGTRTATGGPLLANDPHLDAQMPSVWYEMHLIGGPYNVIGSTFPGTPGVVIGHNEQIAWGVTAASADVQDLYIERFDPINPIRYQYRDQWPSATVVREEIKVKGRQDPVVETVRITRHGPIINNVVEGLGAFLALRWTGLEPGTLFAAVLRLDRARSWNEFRDALRLWTVPALNFVYADRRGNIGYQLPGRIPIRAKGDGLLPVPGWTGEYEWVGEIPFVRLPSVLNPSRGYIVTANNRIVPDSYPYLISKDWDPGFRAKRVETLLATSARVTATEMQKIQLDVTSLPGQATVRALNRISLTQEPAAGLLAELRAWDGELRPDSRAGAIYEAFRLALVPLVFEDRLGADLYKRYRERPNAWQLALQRLLSEPSSPWWSPDGRDRMVAKALNQAHKTLTRRLGPDRSQWSWGRLHGMRFIHPIGRIQVLGWIFNATAPPTGGDLYTVNIGGFDAETFDQVLVASYRQIIDVANWDRSVAMHTTGQSGLPFHPHYRDFVPLWATGRYHPMLFSRASLQQATDAVLMLHPLRTP